MTMAKVHKQGRDEYINTQIKKSLYIYYINIYTDVCMYTCMYICYVVCIAFLYSLKITFLQQLS